MSLYGPDEQAAIDALDRWRMEQYGAPGGDPGAMPPDSNPLAGLSADEVSMLGPDAAQGGLALPQMPHAQALTPQPHSTYGERLAMLLRSMPQPHLQDQHGQTPFLAALLQGVSQGYATSKLSERQTNEQNRQAENAQITRGNEQAYQQAKSERLLRIQHLLGMQRISATKAQAGPEMPTPPDIGNAITAAGGKPPASMTAADAQRWRSAYGLGQATPNANAALSTMTDDDLLPPALNYLRTGQMVRLGLGKDGQELQRRILKYATRLRQSLGISGDIALNKAGVQANAASLSKIQQNLDNVTAFENTALANMDQLLDRAGKIVDTGSQWGNAVARLIQSKAFGNEDVSNFNASLAPVQAEASKILASASMSGQAAVPEREEMRAVVSGNFTLKQLRGTLKVLRQDFKNRRTAYANQLQVINDRLNIQRLGGVTPQVAPNGMVRMAGSDGVPRLVPAEKADEAEANGMVRVP